MFNLDSLEERALRYLDGIIEKIEGLNIAKQREQDKDILFSLEAEIKFWTKKSQEWFDLLHKLSKNKKDWESFLKQIDEDNLSISQANFESLMEYLKWYEQFLNQELEHFSKIISQAIEACNENIKNLNRNHYT